MLYYGTDLHGKYIVLLMEIRGVSVPSEIGTELGIFFIKIQMYTVVTGASRKH